MTTVREPSSSPRRTWLGPWIPVFLAVTIMLPTLRGAFVRDDVAIIERNPRAHSLADLPGIWLADWWSGYLTPGENAPNPGRDRLYRPLALFTIALQNTFHDMAPMPLRIGNILLHAVATLLLWLVSRRLLHDAVAAFVAAILFAVHPVHVEPVAEIVGRAEILAAIGLMLGLLALTPREGNPGFGRICIAAAAFLTALLAKETGVCYLLLAMAVLLHRRGEPDEDMPGLIRRFGSRAAILLLPMAIYLAVRFVALDFVLFSGPRPGNPLNALVGESIANRVIGIFTVLGEYARLTFFPQALSCDYSLGVITPSAGPTVSTMVGLAAAIGLGWLLWRWRLFICAGGEAAQPPERQSLTTRLGLPAALFVASYLLISNSVLTIGVTLAERLWYWPSATVCMGLGVVVAWMVRSAAATASGKVRIATAGIVVAGAVVAFGMRSVNRAADWRNMHALVATDLATNPDSVMLNQWSAQQLTLAASQSEPGPERDQMLQRAEGHLARAVRLSPGFPSIIQQQGLVAELRGDTGTAIEKFEQTLRIDPGAGLARKRLEMLRAAGR